MWNWRLKFLSKYLFSWFSLLWPFSPASCPNETHLSLTGMHSMPAWIDTARHGVTIKWSTKRLKHTENLFRKNLQLRGLLILDLKQYPITRTTERSYGFLHLREASLDTTWEAEHFRLFFIFGCWFSGFELRISELFKCPKYEKGDVTLPDDGF